MKTISALVDFTENGIISPPKIHQSTIYYKDTAFICTAPDDAVFFSKDKTIFICRENTAIIYRPGVMMFKTGDTQLYYTFIGTCFIISTSRDFVTKYNPDGKNIACINRGNYGKFTKKGLKIH